MKRTLIETDQNHPAIKAYVAAIELGSKSQYIRFRDGIWFVKTGLDKSSIKTFKTLDAAKAYAEVNAKQAKASMFVFTADGEIAERKDFN